MEFPEDVLSIIKEYAQPVTQPGWRKLHKMTYRCFYYDINKFLYQDDGEYFITGIIRIRNIYLKQLETGFEIIKL